MAILTLGLASVLDLGKDCVRTDACQDRRAMKTVYCTDDIDTTYGSREVGCAPEMHSAHGSSCHMISLHTCTPEHNTAHRSHSQCPKVVYDLLTRHITLRIPIK